MSGVDVERVAAELTKRQREVIAEKPIGYWWTVLPCSERRQFPNLISRYGYETNILTPLGLAVRAHILESRNPS